MAYSRGGATVPAVFFEKMNLYTTEISAINPKTGDLVTWGGPNVPGVSFDDAQAYCEAAGLGYCKVVGQLVAEIPCKTGTVEPDFSKMVDYSNCN